MTSQAPLVQPPRTANWLINLFAASEEAESLLGDMLEEFSQLASKSGVGFARSWYWRQTRKTVAHLVGHAFRVAPWLTGASVIGGLLLNRLVSGPSERALVAVLFRHQVFVHHSNVYEFFPTRPAPTMKIFPGFGKHPLNRIARSDQATPGVEGYVFDGADGSRIPFWTCREPAVSAAHTHDYDEYMIIVQGCYALIINAERIPMSAGEEYFIRRGVPHSGEVLAGTRTIHVLAATGPTESGDS